MGESPIRGVMTSSGDGVYKSTDGGKTWQHMGLENTLHISQIRVHPADPDLVYVGAQGNPYGPSTERGVYRSDNGGIAWVSEDERELKRQTAMALNEAVPDPDSFSPGMPVNIGTDDFVVRDCLFEGWGGQAQAQQCRGHPQKCLGMHGVWPGFRAC